MIGSDSPAGPSRPEQGTRAEDRAALVVARDSRRRARLGGLLAKYLRCSVSTEPGTGGTYREQGASPKWIVIDCGAPAAGVAAEIRRLRRVHRGASILVLAPDASRADGDRMRRAGADQVISGADADLAFVDWCLDAAAGVDVSGAQLGDAGFKLDAERGILVVGGWTVRLTPSEFKCMALLLERAGTPVSVEDFLRHALGYSIVPRTSTVRRQIANLRRRLGTEGWRIVNCYGRGYRLDLGEDKTRARTLRPPRL